MPVKGQTMQEMNKTLSIGKAKQLKLGIESVNNAVIGKVELSCDAFHG
jgi:hypothetical protein